MKTIRLTGGRKVPSKLQIKSAENKSTFIQYVGSYTFLFNMSVLVLFYKQFSKCFVGQNKKHKHPQRVFGGRKTHAKAETLCRGLWMCGRQRVDPGCRTHR